VNREEIIKTLASLVTMNGDYPHQVDLLNPDLTIVVEIVKVILKHLCVHIKGTDLGFVTNKSDSMLLRFNGRGRGEWKTHNVPNVVESSSGKGC
jgi:hypothetical protein